MLQKIVALVIPGIAPFEFGVVCEVFGIDRTDSGGPTFDFHVVAAELGEVARDGPDLFEHVGGGGSPSGG